MMENCVQNLNYRKPIHHHRMSNNMDNGEIKPYKAGKDRVRRVVDNTGRKRRIYSIIHNDPKQSTRRFRANDRERRRMTSLNGALQALKGCVPSYHGKKRLTKLQILKFACHYISDLSDILYSSSSSSSISSSDSPLPMMNDSMEQSEDDCGTMDFTNGCMEAFMSFMAQQQQEHQLPNVNNNNNDINNNGDNIIDNSINGLNMMQRLDYLSCHNYFETENNINNNFDNNNDIMVADTMSTLPQHHSVLYNQLAHTQDTTSSIFI